MHQVAAKQGIVLHILLNSVACRYLWLVEGSHWYAKCRVKSKLQACASSAYSIVLSQSGKATKSQKTNFNVSESLVAVATSAAPGGRLVAQRSQFYEQVAQGLHTGSDTAVALLGVIVAAAVQRSLDSWR